MVWKEYEPKPFEENDVDIKITHCGICGSDIHTLRSGWAPTDYSCVVGHEIVGHAARVGSKVKSIKVGDRVGVGAQSGACMNQKGDCEACADGLQQHCPHIVETYNGKWPDGSKSYGGYADYWRGSADFVIPIPDSLSSEEAAPMLCGGVTVFSPLTQYGAGPGKKVGIIGVGGLGHFGIMGAKALDCSEIIAISRSSTKKEDALKMGATGFIATDEDEDWATKHAGTLDLIVSTGECRVLYPVNAMPLLTSNRTVSSPKMPLQQYLQLLGLKGKFVQVGGPEDVVPPINMFSLILKRVSITGSLIGSPQEIKDMLKLFAEKGVHTWNVNVPMSEANKAVADMDAGKARYRYVLVNEKHLQ